MTELKKPSALQLRHNDGKGFVAAYEKEEMDNYLFELGEVIVKLNTDCEEANTRLSIAKLINEHERALINEQRSEILRHQKYKRCLAMAERCKDKIENVVQYNEHDDWLIINEYWERWHERWLKIAKQFKEEA